MVIYFTLLKVLFVTFHGQVSKLVEIMTANPPSMVPGWTIDKNQTLALLHNKQWFRGVAVRKTGDHFSVYRVDLGDIVTVPKNSLRPLSAPYCRWQLPRLSGHATLVPSSMLIVLQFINFQSIQYISTPQAATRLPSVLSGWRRPQRGGDVES